jgi:hypothetical protein
MEAAAMTKKPPKRNRRKRQIYSGKLAEPGHSRFRLPLEGRSGDIDTRYNKSSAEETVAQNAATINSEAENLLLLMDHYRIDRDHEDRWCLLAFALARDHVPAFRAPPKRGRPKKDIDKMKVYSAVRKRIAKNKALSVSQAIKYEKEKDKKKYSGVPENTISAWYYEVLSVVKASSKEAKEREELKKQGLWHPDRD